MNSLRIVLAITLVIAAIHPITASAQSNDPIDSLRKYPPSIIPHINAVNLDAINWQLVQVDANTKLLNERDAKINKQIQMAGHEIQALNQQLPDPTRLLDAATRSALVGKVMEKLLDARLELATYDVSIELFEKRLAEATKEKKPDPTQKQLEIKVRASALKVEVAMAEAEKSRRLAKTGSKSNSDVQMAQYTADIARLELEGALAKVEAYKNDANSNIANQLADLRLEAAPFQARIATSEEFLKTFVDSQSLLPQIERLQRERDNWEEDKRRVVQQLNELSNKSGELQFLKRFIEAETKKRESLEKSPSETK